MRQFTELLNSSHGPCLIIGNGPSLRDIPEWFLSDAYPSFACNFFNYHRPEVWLDHLVLTDRSTIEEPNVYKHLFSKTKVLVFDRWIDYVPESEKHRVYGWANKVDKIDGFTFGDVYGQYFPTSGHAAVWMADKMGYDRFYLVGMDGTSQQRELSGVDSEGRSNIPHFYNTEEKPAKNSMLWDIAWGNIYRHMYHNRGKEIINLSTETAITQLPREDLREHIATNPHRRMWTKHIERA